MASPKAVVWTRETLMARCDEVGDCLIWRGFTMESGMPQARINGKTTNVRNFVFCKLMGKALPDGYVVQPKCGNRSCVSDNCLVRMSISKWRQTVALTTAQTPVGLRQQQQQAVKAGFSKVGPDLAAVIRKSGEPTRILAKRYGVDLRTIHRIRNRQSWAPIQNSIFNLGG